MEKIEEVVSAIEALTEEVRTLREALDEFREDYQWAVRNHDRPIHITSMSADPCADDFKVNAVPRDKIEELRRQTRLFR